MSYEHGTLHYMSSIYMELMINKQSYFSTYHELRGWARRLCLFACDCVGRYGYCVSMFFYARAKTSRKLGVAMLWLRCCTEYETFSSAQ